MRAKRSDKGSTAAVVLGKVEDQGEGVYRAVYIASFAGTYEVSVTSNGETEYEESIPVSHGICTSRGITPTWNGD